MERILKAANDMKDKVDTLDFDYVAKNEHFFTKFFEYSDVCPDIVSFIKALTNFKYEPFQNISLDNRLNAPERIVYIYKLSDIFNYPFIDSVNINWKFDKLEDSILSFISEHEDSTVIEYKLLKSLLGKLIILMCSNVEQAFADKKSNINPDTEKYLSNWIDKMSEFGKMKNNVSKSWNIFINTLMNSSEIYVHESDAKLHELLACGYNSHFLLESLAANVLKTFQTTILVDYFHAIKSVYIWVRLVSILIQKYKLTPPDQLMNNIYLISTIVIAMYEDNYLISSILPKSLPSNDSLTEETILYYLNHTIKGPQYFILKQLQYSGPCVLNVR